MKKETTSSCWKNLTARQHFSQTACYHRFRENLVLKMSLFRISTNFFLHLLYNLECVTFSGKRKKGGNDNKK